MNEELREALAKQSFKFFKGIVDASCENAELDKLCETGFGHIGTDNMTEEQLFSHYTTLRDNYYSIFPEEKSNLEASQMNVLK